MITENPSTEPSMDEILASIRKIISADSQEDSPSFFPVNETEDILDLTNALPEELEKRQDDPISSDFHLNDLGEWSPLTEKVLFPQEKEKKPQNRETEMPSYEPTTPSREDVLLSQKTMSEATQAFHLLHKLAEDKPQSAELRSPEGTGGQTVEMLIREMLKPLLKEWLDAHLPSLVRSIVNQQVEKIVGQASSTPRERDKTSTAPYSKYAS